MEPDLLTKLQFICQNHRDNGGCNECPLSYDEPYGYVTKCDVQMTLGGVPGDWEPEYVQNLMMRAEFEYNKNKPN